MLGFRRKKHRKDRTAESAESAAPTPERSEAPGRSEPAEPSRAVQDEGRSRAGWLDRLHSGLRRTGSGFSALFLGRKAIDQELLEELETLLLMADVGVEATQRIIDNLTERLKRNQLADATALQNALRDDMIAILAPCTQPLVIDTRPYVILTVGVNGVGKTTIIGKLGRRLQDNGYEVMLAAGDTFRAAAVEQLKIWGERGGIPVIAQPTGADAASVIYDAHQAALARGIGVLIADTAGRLHTQSNLMDELRKIKRVLSKQDAAAPHEVLLVVDASTGQNALAQAREFHAAVGVTGIALTKLDGTAKGGVIFAIAQQLGLPIRCIGVGEQIEDLRPFTAEEFVDALLAVPAQESAAE